MPSLISGFVHLRGISSGTFHNSALYIQVFKDDSGGIV